MPGGGGNDELRAFAQHDQHGLRLDQGSAALDHELEDPVELGDPADRVGDVARRLEAAHGTLELLAALLAALIQARVLDRHGGEIGEDHGRLLVGLGEPLAVALLRQIQVAPRLAADHDRDAQKAPHHRMPGGEAVAVRVVADVSEAQWRWVGDQRAEDTAAARKISDRPMRLGVDPERDETLELETSLVEHTEGRVLRAGRHPRLLEDPIEDRLGVELGDE